MASGVFNIAKGRAAYYATLPEASDALIVVVLKVAEDDATLIAYDSLGALLAGSNTEADFTNYARKTVTAATVTVDDINDRVDVDIADQLWASAGGTTNNTTAKALICYDADTGAGDDDDVIPLTHHDFVATTNGSDLALEFAAAGFYRAS